MSGGAFRDSCWPGKDRAWDDGNMKRMALFFSGTGGNAFNLLEACRDGRIPGQVVLGVASTAKATSLELRLLRQSFSAA